MLSVSITNKQLEQKFDALLASPRLEGDECAHTALHVFRPRHILLAQAIGKYLDEPRTTIADIGCQNGFFLRLCADLGFTRFLGIDYFPMPPERSFLSELNGVEFVKANFNEDHFLRDIPNDSVDCVVSTEVFEHIYHHPLGYLRECWRILRPGGLLLFSTPNPCTLANAARLARGRSMSWGGVEFARQPKVLENHQPLAVWDIHFREYAPSELATIINELPGVRIREQGFLASGVDPASPLAKQMILGFAHKVGLSRWRPISPTQYMVLQKEPSNTPGTQANGTRTGA